MIINRLRANQIAKLPDGKHLDGQGLYLRVEGNSRRWFLRFSFEGKRHDLGLGRLTLSEAREKAEEVRRQIADGKHPLITRAMEVAARKKSAVAAKGLHSTLRDIVADALDWYHEKNTLRTKDWTKQALSQMERHILPVLGSKPLGLITPEDIADVLRPKWSCTTGGTWLTYLRACFKYAMVKGYFTGKAPTEWDGCLEFHLPKASKVVVVEHRSACTWQDMPALYAKVSALPDSASKRFVLACMLCIPRPGEFAALTVPDIDTEKRIITIQTSKTSTEPWPLPYPTQMDAVFDFTAQHPFGRELERHAAAKYLRRNIEEPYTVHGFRASFSSWCADHEKNPETREACLHHSLGGKVTLAYQRSNLLELRRKLLQEWADYISTFSPS